MTACNAVKPPIYYIWLSVIPIGLETSLPSTSKPFNILVYIFNEHRFILIHFCIESGLSYVKRDMCKSHNHPHIHMLYPICKHRSVERISHLLHYEPISNYNIK